MKWGVIILLFLFLAIPASASTQPDVHKGQVYKYTWVADVHYHNEAGIQDNDVVVNTARTVEITGIDDTYVHVKFQDSTADLDYNCIGDYFISPDWTHWNESAKYGWEYCHSFQDENTTFSIDIPHRNFTVDRIFSKFGEAGYQSHVSFLYNENGILQHSIILRDHVNTTAPGQVYHEYVKQDFISIGKAPFTIPFIFTPLWLLAAAVLAKKRYRSLRTTNNNP